jgi:uncharacterized protein with ParB-like and HNH nuclease domain
MEANPVRIVQYFDGEKQSIIPLFQRPYTWNKRNWDSLWGDIMSYYDGSISSSSHFMGAVVSIPARTVPIGVTKHLVIDGQQRLTTVAILLCSLRDSIDDRKSAQIQDYLVNRHYDNSADFLKILPTQGDRDAYLKIIKGTYDKNKDNHLINDCYEHFKKLLMGKDENDDAINPNRILDIVKSQLQVVMINLGESDDPYLIFESLNYKGEPLSQADLVRNYVLMRFRYSLGDGGEQERIYREIWHPMESRLNYNLEDFLWHNAIKNGENIKKPKVYTLIKTQFNEIREVYDVERSIIEMNMNSMNYSRFINPEKETNVRIEKELQLLKRFEATITYPLLLKIFRANDNDQFDEDTLINCLKHINSVILRRAVCSEKRSALNRLFISISSKIPDEIERLDEWLANEFSRRVRSERWPDNDEFRSAIIHNKLYGTKAGRILLEGIETTLAGKEAVDLNSDKITIEHIMPQTLSDEWKSSIGHNYVDTHKRYSDTLGNLTLTGFNSELGNMSFFQKKSIYSESSLSMNRQLAIFETWGETEIIQRAEKIADQAIKIWSRPTI